ncbi:MAG: alpha/beta hydrolase [Pseudomonadota bacterium]|nr:alpha/beta hydrolase [Pseudomonadota bacterium]
MPTLTANGIRIAFDTTGDARGVPLLLIHGLGMQQTAWPDALVDGLAEQGFFVIRFDNRDCGLSTKFDASGTPNLALAWLKKRLRLPLRPPYRLDDMAQDAVGVLSALGIGRAHVVGVSMGAMIAQSMAARHAGRVLSLTSIMSTSNRRGLPGPGRAVRAAMLRQPRDPGNVDGVLDHAVALWRLIGSPSYPTADAVLRQRVLRALRRSHCPSGAARQLLAIAAAPDASPLLRQITAPTLVIHGANDALVPPACGVDVARQIPGARLEMIEGMGHDLPDQLIERLLALIDMHAHGKMHVDSTVRLSERQ